MWRRASIKTGPRQSDRGNSQLSTEDGAAQDIPKEGVPMKTNYFLATILCLAVQLGLQAVASAQATVPTEIYHRGRVATESTTSTPIFWGLVALRRDACNIVTRI
jgi:hypothetical protein